MILHSNLGLKELYSIDEAGGGTNTGKSLHVANFGFTILDEGELAYSAAGNHRIAIFKDTEYYGPLKLALWDIAVEVESLNTIKDHDKDIQKNLNWVRSRIFGHVYWDE